MADTYLQELLSRDEAVLIDTRQHWMAMVRFALKPFLLLGLVVLLLALNLWLDFDGVLSFLNTVLQLVLVVAAIAAAIWLPIDIIRWRSRKYILTNRRVMRLDGVLTKNSYDSSLEKINDIQSSQSVLGRAFGYADLVFYTASDEANEQYDQLMDGLQFKKAVLDAKEGIRKGHPLMALREGFVVKGGTNAASRGAAGGAGPAEEAAAGTATSASATSAPAEPSTAAPAASGAGDADGEEGSSGR